MRDSWHYDAVQKWRESIPSFNRTRGTTVFASLGIPSRGC